jgi:GNAT superfamily N-acetyltransferase
MKIGKLAAKTYYDTGLSEFLSPKRDRYYSDYERGFKERAFQRMADPRNLTIAAYLASEPGTPIGCVQFVRMGDDEGAKRQIEGRKSVWLWIAGLLFVVWCVVLKWAHGTDRSANVEAEKLFDTWCREEEKTHWSSVPERKNRWHVQSCVVSEEYQGKGIGKRLMGEVLKRADAENVIVGLEATGPGEQMYMRVGFVLLERFVHNFEGGAGGIMMWTPPELKKRGLGSSEKFDGT